MQVQENSGDRIRGLRHWRVACLLVAQDDQVPPRIARVSWDCESLGRCHSDAISERIVGHACGDGPLQERPAESGDEAIGKFWGLSRSGSKIIVGVGINGGFDRIFSVVKIESVNQFSA